MTPTPPVVRQPRAPAGRRIPFDQSFRFDLAGRPQRTVSQTTTVSTEGPFTAVSIGYGFDDDADERVVREFGPAPGEFARPLGVVGARLVNLGFQGLVSSLARAAREAGPAFAPEPGPRTRATLERGIRLNPRFAAAALSAGGNTDIDPSLLDRLFEAVPFPAESIQFLYALRDEATGREFQSEPVLSTAGLGSASGRRPFRRLACPITFAPRATIRMDVTELSRVRGRLHVSLHGYKTLGGGEPAPGGPRGGLRAR